MADDQRDVARPASAPAFVATLALVVVLIGLLLSLDVFLVRIDRRETSAHAAREYDLGVRLLHSGDAAAAVEHLTNATTLDRLNIDYSLALAQAKLSAGDL